MTELEWLRKQYIMMMGIIESYTDIVGSIVSEGGGSEIYSNEFLVGILGQAHTGMRLSKEGAEEHNIVLDTSPFV